jgi:hypothetical protein
MTSHLGDLEDFGTESRSGAAWWRSTAADGDQATGETTMIWLTGVFADDNVRYRVIDLIAGRAPATEVAEVIQSDAPNVRIHTMLTTGQFKTDPGAAALAVMFEERTPAGWAITPESEPYQDDPNDSA